MNAGYTLNFVKNGMETIERITDDVPDLILVNLGLLDVPGHLVIIKLKQMPKTQDIPYILYTSQSSVDAPLAKMIRKVAGINVVCSADSNILLGEAKRALQKTTP